MARHAIIDKSGVVQNVVLWNPKESPDWAPPEGCIAIECKPEVGIGWTWNGASFEAPAPVAAQPGPSDLVAELTAKLDALMDAVAKAGIK